MVTIKRNECTMHGIYKFYSVLIKNMKGLRMNYLFFKSAAVDARTIES